MGARDMSMPYCLGYSDEIDVIREYTTYLDHAGTTLYAKSLIDSFSRDLTCHLYGNPHSMSVSSQLSTQRIDDIRLRALRFFNASPDEFDLVFVANATAAIKLVADAFRDSTGPGFWYGYHVDAHTSLVGVRELAERGSRCFTSDEEVESWIDGDAGPAQKGVRLFAYPAQSNMHGRRYPRRWCESIRTRNREGPPSSVYTLLDAASLVSTSPLDLSDVAAAPDFTVLSFYKIFGFPDLGALIVRKGAARVLEHRRFFGGGTVDMVLTGEAQPWHAKKESSIHERLEDGTLPFHSIIALDCAFETHRRLFGSMENVAAHTRFLAKQLYTRMAMLRHYNDERVCHFYGLGPSSDYCDSLTQGPILAFNLRNSHGMWVGKSEVEKLASIKKIQIRSGTLCNPGGTALSLGWTGADMLRHYSAGLRCGDEHDIMDEQPTGILRVSLGAMSSMRDINAFMAFLEEFYVDKPPEDLLVPLVASFPPQQPSFYVESLSVFPIKSCGAFKVPDGQRWEVRREGLAWDREWCLVHQGTGMTLNQKRYPRMALIQPTLDLTREVLRITRGDAASSPEERKSLEISLRRENTSSLTTSLCQNTSKASTVCGDKVVLQAYTSPVVSTFFTHFLGVPWAERSQLLPPTRKPTACPVLSQANRRPPHARKATRILLSNESPLLLISRSSVNRLNEAIKSGAPNTNAGIPGPGSNSSSKKAVAADVFRANLVVAETIPTAERPYVEDTWQSLRIGSEQMPFAVLGSCERCQMVCVDQLTGQRWDEPFATLAKTRKINRKILFGRHISPAAEVGEGGCLGTVMVGDVVTPSFGDHDDNDRNEE
ncbi:hypothetical protein ARAM_001150 [Aspergillus rambellii]|uniref:Molybdenum cofactor sulfurase n=1 Tax=Aspergillus rambellii TaxID=308745 RepID=A0A0F8XBU8_9EURO|nr:hypothetical protein ARAM_001150 [Aspergillus rambellii]